jgi:ribosomal protein S6--L-glutamate ligase
MRIGFLMRRPGPGGQSVTTEVVRLLRGWEVSVDLIQVDGEPTDLAEVKPEHDLYVMRAVNDASLSLGAILERQGARCLNRVEVSRTCRDKALVIALLRRAGVPVPDTWIVDRPGELGPLLAQGPLVVKPLHGSQGRGVHVVWDADELVELGASPGPLIGQRFHPREGRDRKLYCIGGQLFGVKRQWPATTYEQKWGEPFTVTSDLADIARIVGEVIGTDLFGLDVVISGGEPCVVDVNPFPGFKGVPDAALRLADYIYAAAAPDSP